MACTGDQHRRDVMRRAASVDQQTARHRALGDPTRLALLGVLEGSSEPMDAHVLARRVGLHVNTIRWHLGVLVEAGLVIEERAGSGARGRPRHSYRFSGDALTREPTGFRLLAEVLADAIARPGPDLAGTLEEAGRVRGRTLIRPRFSDDPSVDAAEALEWVVRLLETFGFRPRLEHTKEGERIAMRPCPFGEMATRNASIICPVHLGLMRGTLEALRAPVEATLLEPFAKPDLCIAHFRVRPESAGDEPAEVEVRPGAGASAKRRSRSAHR
jgi:predicted ArsR family transcriptional regulator